MKFFIIILLVINYTVNFAIIYRHDKDSSDYLKLAQEEQFNCVGRMFKIINESDTTDKWESRHAKGDTLKPWCSCELISEQYVLSAAHCFTNLIKKDTTYIMDDGTKIDSYIVLGENQLPSSKFRFDLDGRLLEADTIILHSKYFSLDVKGQWNNYDVAIIKLKEPVTKIKIPKLNKNANEVGRKAVGVGWGYYGGAYDKELNYGKKLAGENMIDTIWNFRDGLPGTLVYDFDSPTDSNCNKTGDSKPLNLEFSTIAGDSGGGLFIEKKGQWLLAGVSPSAGINIEQFRKTGYYCHSSYWVRISTILDWINQSIKNTK
ncbi:MAG: trypsin-like serine protease [Bacteroidetes bacterium]|nr:MAG: trypsin-like serine protease [Bacteroidota bacterium]